MKIIFLDIDGVLNSHNSLDRLWSNMDSWKKSRSRDMYFLKRRIKIKGETYKHFRYRKWMDRKHLRQLQRLVSDTGAYLVLSSSWRKGNNYKEMEKLWKEMFGIKVTFIGQTPSFQTGFRGDEIKYWLDNCPYDVENYIILDDDDDMRPEQMNHLFKTSYKYGLTIKIRRRASKYLKGELKCPKQK